MNEIVKGLLIGSLAVIGLVGSDAGPTPARFSAATLNS